jgi:hypothetical protein
MAINFKKLKTSVAALAFACVMGTLSQSSAVNTVLTIGDAHDLGLIDPNHPADPVSSAGFIDTLLAQPLNSGPTIIGANAFTRTGNDPLGGVYPAAEFAVDLGAQNLNIDLGTGFQYLLGKYDGPNFGSVVWFVGDLTGLIDIPATGGGFGLSHTFLFNGVPPPGVPDGGTTLMLLGSALACLGVLRRRFAS